jgi:hypothetical protein
MHNLRSTFPLDEHDILRTAVRKVLGDPITWVPLLPVVAAYTIFDVPGFIVAGMGGVVVGGLGLYWRVQWDGLTASLRQKMIADHNAAQNALLRDAAKKMRSAGARTEAKLLDRFIELKAQVESRLHAGGVLTQQKMQMDQLVDSLCFGVRDQLCGLAGLGNSPEAIPPEKVHSQVAAALATLEGTVGELDVILGPGEAPAGLADGSLDEVMRRLREESEIARRVQARLRQTGTIDAPPEPKMLENQ